MDDKHIEQKAFEYSNGNKDRESDIAYEAFIAGAKYIREIDARQRAQKAYCMYVCGIDKYN